MGCVISRRKWLIIKKRSRGWSPHDATALSVTVLEHRDISCKLTVIAQFVLVQHSASTLMRDIRDPDAADSDVLRLELLI